MRAAERGEFDRNTLAGDDAAQGDLSIVANGLKIDHRVTVRCCKTHVHAMLLGGCVHPRAGDAHYRCADPHAVGEREDRRCKPMGAAGSHMLQHTARYEGLGPATDGRLRHHDRARRGNALEDEEWLREISTKMDPEDGHFRVCGVGDDQVPVFTGHGTECLSQIIIEEPSIGARPQPENSVDLRHSPDDYTWPTGFAVVRRCVFGATGRDVAVDVAVSQRLEVGLAAIARAR
jgi:hypothetical protein